MLVNYQDSSNNFHGSIHHNGMYTPLDFPGAVMTYTDGINAGGQIAGNYVVGSQTYGFVYDAGAWYSLNYPGSSGTHVYNINNAGQIAGYYVDQRGLVHSLLVTAVPEPGSMALFVGMSVVGAGFVRCRKRRGRRC